MMRHRAETRPDVSYRKLIKELFLDGRRYGHNNGAHFREWPTNSGIGKRPVDRGLSIVAIPIYYANALEAEPMNVRCYNQHSTGVWRVVRPSDAG